MTLAIADPSGKLKVRIPASGEDILSQILLAIAHKGVIRASYKKLKRNVALNQGKILEVADAVLPYQREDLTVRIVDDGYQALLGYMPSVQFPQAPHFFEMLWILVNQHVIFGIDFDELDRIASEHDFSRGGEWVVAKGRRHVPGRPAQLEYHVSTEVSHAPLVLANGRVDYKSIDAVKLVVADQRLVTKHPATDGAPGITVTGRTVEVQPGSDTSLPGDNTYVSEDGRSLHAKVSGHLYVTSGLLNVEKVLIIRTNVDYSTGHLRFAGDVVVMGDVVSGFEVEAEGGVFIKGNVEAARVRAAKGNVEVLGGVFGNGRAELWAGRSLRVDFADNAKLSAGEDIVVNKYLTNCSATAGRALEVHGSGGAIIGGTAVAGERILATVVGSDRGGRTRLVVSHREGEVDGLSLDQLDKEIAGIDAQLAEAEKAAALVAQLKGDLSSLTPSQRNKIAALVRGAAGEKARRATLEERRLALLQRRKRIKFGAVRIERDIFPGAEVEILGAVYHVTAPMSGTIFGLSDDGAITLNK
ncbi:DUF342 domain-containing protein [bacterium]|nr:DUF342 domain-containing protein [bacterium]